MTARDKTLSLLEIVISSLVIIAIGLSGWSMRTTVVLATEVATINASRFTAKDGLAVYKEMADVRRDLATLAASMPDAFPPSQFDDRVKRIEDKIDKLDDRLDRIERGM